MVSEMNFPSTLDVKLGCRYFGISIDIDGKSLHVYTGLEDTQLSKKFLAMICLLGA